MPKAWRLIEKQAQPSVWVSCKLTPVSCAPVRSSVSLRAVNICPSPRAGQLWRLQLTDRPGARKGVKGRNLQARNAGGGRRSRGGEVGRTEQTQVPGAPLGKYAPLSARPSGAEARVAAAGSTPLARQQKNPAVGNVACLLAGKPGVFT